MTSIKLSWAWHSLTLACFILPSSVLALVSKFCVSLSIISDFDPHPHDSSDVGWNWPCKVSGCFLMTHRCSWEKLDWPLEFGFSYKLMIPHFKSQFGDTKWHITQDETNYTIWSMKNFNCVKTHWIFLFGWWIFGPKIF